MEGNLFWELESVVTLVCPANELSVNMADSFVSPVIFSLLIFSRAKIAAGSFTVLAG